MKKKKSKKVSKVKTRQTAKHSLGQPYGDRVLVKPMRPEETTSFGLIIPDTAKEKPEQGVVVAVGPGRKNDDGKTMPLSVKAGDRIMFSKYGYDEITIDEEEFYMVAENNILAVVK